MAVTTRHWTLDEIVKEWGYDVPYQVIDGELREVSPCGGDSSRVGLRLGGYLFQFNEEHDLGEAFGADGGFVLSRDPLVLVSPDASFVRTENIPPDYDFRGFFPGAPDFAAEVPSPSDRPGEVEEKIERLLGAGTELVWKADPILRLVEVRRRGRPPRTFYIGDVLDGEDVIPGFRLPVARLFREPRGGRATARRSE
jgi:Uma2 family endonuclease